MPFGVTAAPPAETICSRQPWKAAWVQQNQDDQRSSVLPSRTTSKPRDRSPRLERTMLSGGGGGAGRMEKSYGRRLNTGKYGHNFTWGQSPTERTMHLLSLTLIWRQGLTEAETSRWIGNEFSSGAVYRSLICFTFDSVDITMCYFSHSSLTSDQKDFSFLFMKPDLNLSVWLPSQYPHM